MPGASCSTYGKELDLGTRSIAYLHFWFMTALLLPGQLCLLPGSRRASARDGGRIQVGKSHGACRSERQAVNASGEGGVLRHLTEEAKRRVGAHTLTLCIMGGRLCVNDLPVGMLYLFFPGPVLMLDMNLASWARLSVIATCCP
jgi:hypothetical protein